jgi:cellulose synthase/poly-beta-1,6-N-acetylglucosamine synthase-like glycosyltransferase
MEKSDELLPGISAYVPAYNNENTIEAAVRSLLNQTIAPDELFVIDDGSLDNTRIQASYAGVEVFSNGTNRGRGYSRAKAVELARHEFLLCCDATNTLEPDFLEKTLPFFKDSSVASISGHLRSSVVNGSVARWRSRHLFKEDISPGPPRPVNMLITYGTLMRTSAVKEVGNFNKTLFHTEDHELGLRLHSAGYKILGSPDAVIRSIAPATLWKTLERYWRWYAGVDEKVSIRNYLHTIKGSIRPMAEKDIANRDFAAALISLLCPHYCMWKSLSRKLAGKSNLK